MNIIDIFNVDELKGYAIDVNLILGAGMTYTDIMDLFLQLSAEKEEFSYLKQFYDHMDLVAHIPVRNVSNNIFSLNMINIYFFFSRNFLYFTHFYGLFSPKDSL